MGDEMLDVRHTQHDTECMETLNFNVITLGIYIYNPKPIDPPYQAERYLIIIQKHDG